MFAHFTGIGVGHQAQPKQVLSDIYDTPEDDEKPTNQSPFQRQFERSEEVHEHWSATSNSSRGTLEKDSSPTRMGLDASMAWDANSGPDKNLHRDLDSDSDIASDLDDDRSICSSDDDDSDEDDAVNFSF